MIKLEFPDSMLFAVDATPTWYEDVVMLLSTGRFPEGLEARGKRRLLLKCRPFQLIAGQLYKMGRDAILRRCVNPHEVPLIVEDAHAGPAGGHFPGHITAQKIMQAGLWWPSLFADCKQHVRHCDVCQRSGPKPTSRNFRPLQVSTPWGPFERWGIDFVGPITPKTHSTGCEYILVATDYATKWTEAKATRDNTAATVARFLYEF